MRSPIVLLDIKREMHPEAIRAAVPEGRVIACDFKVEGAESGEAFDWGWRLDGIDIVDHHAESPRMYRAVSSANLAIERVRACGPARPDETVVVNHTDCDSVLSSAIVVGRLPPDHCFGEAAIAADHTGEANEIADLLQGLDPLRDLELSMQGLEALLSGRPLDSVAAGALRRRLAMRARAEREVAGGRFRRAGGVAFAVFEESIDGELFMPLLRDAAVLMTARPARERPGWWVMKVRLGLGAPPELTLYDLRITEFDPAYGGRWNAGSNRRGGGTTMAPDAYAEQLAARSEQARVGLGAEGIAPRSE